MRDEPNVELRCQTTRASDTINGVDSSRQQDGGHGSRNPLRSVLQLTCRMNQPRKLMALQRVTDTQPLLRKLCSNV